MYLDGAILDEYALFKPSVFSQVVRPALSDRLGWGCFVSTPRGKNLFYDVCQQGKKDPENWYTLTLRADESGIIPVSELAALQRDMDPEEFAQEYLCSFDSALKGAIYADEVNKMFLEGRCVQTDIYDQNLPVHCSFDLGFTDATVCIWFQCGLDGRVRVVACEATTGTDIFFHIEKILQFGGELGDVFLPHDARARNLQTGVSIVEQFIKNGIKPRIVTEHKIRDGIMAVRKLFPAITINEQATGDLVEALKGYRRQWDDNKLMFADAPLHDWCSDYADAFRYMAIACSMLGFTGIMGAEGKKKVETRSHVLLTSSMFNLDTLHADATARKGGGRPRIM